MNNDEMLILQLVAVFECDPMIWICGNRSVNDGMVIDGMVIDGVAHHDAVLKLIEF